MRTLDESVSLARAMVSIGKQAGKPIFAVVTGMDQPLGNYVGNALEVREAVDILSGRTEGDLLTVSLELGSLMLTAAGAAVSPEEGKEKLREALKEGRGLKKLKEMLSAQGGDARVCDDIGLLPLARMQIPVAAQRDGWVTCMDTTEIGNCARDLGAGRWQKNDAIDPAAGLVMKVRLGDHVQKGDLLAVLHADKENAVPSVTRRMQDAITLSDHLPEKLPPLFYARISPEDV